jgi:hypothetical protein
MCRPLKPLFWGLFCALLGLPTTGRAQPSLPDEIFFSPDSTVVKELARAAFEDSQATPRDLARGRVEAARIELLERYRILEHYRNSTFEPVLESYSHLPVLESYAQLAEAEFAALEKPTPADRLAVLATRWLFALSAELSVEGRYRFGHVPLADLMQARQTRLDAEIKLRAAGARQKLSDSFPSVALSFAVEEALFGPGAKEVAQSAFAAGRADLRDLAVARRDAARTSFQVQMVKYLAGAPDATFDLLLESSAQLAEAELDPVGEPTPTDRLAALAARWEHALSAEQIVGAKYRVDRVSLADLMQARSVRLGAEIKLRGAGQKLSDPFLVPTLPPRMLEDPFYDSIVTEVARSAFAAGRADLRALAVERRDVARSGYRERMEKYRAGTQGGTLDLRLEAARQLLEAELAVRDDPAERLAAIERYWGQMSMAEDIVRRQYEVGRVSLAEYTRTRYNRLGAEMRMRAAEEKMNKK